MGVSKIFVYGAVALCGLLAVLLLRTVTLGFRSADAPPCKAEDTDFIRADQGLIGRFQKALQFQTVSKGVHDYNAKEMQNIIDFIHQEYKTLHSSPLVTHEVIANYSLLYVIKGSDPSLKPYLLMGHLDVVPVDPAKWDVPAFTGEIKDGYIYGRGTIDDKHTVFGILEALEFHLKRGFKPRRSIYVQFGHDEEVGGVEGAYAVSQALLKRGLQFEFILDEGLVVVDGVAPGVKEPVAMIGSSEKGWLTLQLKVNTSGGHSSMPPKESSIGILSNALAKLENNPHPSMFGLGPEKGMFEHMAPNMKFPLRMIMSNLWFFGPLVSKILSNKPSTNALIRTTTAITQFHAGIKDNVLAPWAWATVNHRIHPASSVKEVLEYDRAIINDDRVQIEVKSSFEPHPQSPYCDECFGFQTLKTSVRQVWSYAGVVVTPGVMVANTDTRHYLKLSSNIYRFSPSYMYEEDLPRFHGVNERIPVKNYEEAVNFFYHVIANADKPQLEPMHTHGDEF